MKTGLGIKCFPDMGCAAQQVGETGVSAHLRFGYRHQWRARREGLAVLNSGGDWFGHARPGMGCGRRCHFKGCGR